MNTQNAKDNLRLIDLGNILCAEIDIDILNENITKKLELKIGFTEEDLGILLKELDFNYIFASYPQVEGTIWMKDGSWYESTCEENVFAYGFSEDWTHIVCPQIPSKLK